MCPALERADSPEHKRGQQIVSRHAVLLQRDDVGMNLIDFQERILGVILPVLLLLRQADYESRQVDFVGVGGVLEPLLARLKTLDPGKGGTPTRYDSGGTALSHGLNDAGIVFVEKNLGPEHKIFGPQVNGRPEAEITLTTSDKGGE